MALGSPSHLTTWTSCASHQVSSVERSDMATGMFGKGFSLDIKCVDVGRESYLFLAFSLV
ncbi:hypothetical protein M378DRAFT_362019 [Amanita muscaria Koide BX008]|uniref:Uncharacterized protein n=1 Tax=Amanita muscaria (strain Koide BX008) TaxID=946122 RepID=A0A0C2SUN0_AMAMK|nr:hypothetical protein M378DRAFT_362019 [Amanita muscaria Koide BX008]